jgi:DNA-binding MarR family transcriptional regulator
MPRKDRIAPKRHFSAGVRLVERSISPDGDPVIGLYLYMVSGWLTRSMGRGSRFARIKPKSIGIPALLKAHPGLSQTELADLMGMERMTAGTHIARCIRDGLVRRKPSEHDRRKYSLFVTAKGEANLRRVADLIPEHEQFLFGALSRADRASLYRLLRKLADSSASRGGHL